MKTNWMIAVEAAEYKNILALLTQKNIKVLQQMDQIFVILVEATAKMVEPLKEVKGVLAIEQEGQVTVQ